MSTQPDGYRRQLGFEPPERVPWSELGPEFAEIWGRPEGRHDPEHVEITGQSGSGKTYLLVALLQERALARGTSEIFVATKKADSTFDLLGWPIVSTWDEVRKYRWCTFWPMTRAVGQEAEKFHEQRIYELLARLWQPSANTVVAWDEIGYVEALSGRLKRLIRQYWREARSHGITIVAMKQRPVGVSRDMHSESRWKFVFPPEDRGDLDRFAELLGTPRDWAPVLDSLDQERHEFVVMNKRRRLAYISWIDYELHPIPSQAHQADRTAHEYLWGRARNR